MVSAAPQSLSVAAYDPRLAPWAAFLRRFAAGRTIPEIKSLRNAIGFFGNA